MHQTKEKGVYEQHRSTSITKVHVAVWFSAFVLSSFDLSSLVFLAAHRTRAKFFLLIVNCEVRGTEKNRGENEHQ